MKTVFKIIALLSISFLVISCKKNDAPKTVDIYIAGEANGVGVEQFARYWKNGELIGISDGSKRAHVSSVFVSGSDVYLAGAEDINPYQNRRAVYWKNRTRIYLPADTNHYSEVNSIFISGNDVYAAGYESTNQGWGAKYWKNGIAVNLTNYLGIAKATSIVVSGTDVYVAGYEYNGSNYVAKYWKNGIAVNLTNGAKNAEAYSIVVSGTDVYVVGKELSGVNSNYIAKYWKNGVPISLTDGTNDAIANTIVVKGNDVYASGAEKNGLRNVAKYWKNGAGTKLSIYDYGDSYAYSLAVSGTDVFVTTYELFPNPPYGSSYSTQYWKNGIKVPFTGIGGKMLLFLVDPL